MKTLKLILVLLFACSSMAVSQTSAATHLIELEDRFNDALVRADLKTVEEIEADDLIFTDSSGMVTTKSDELQSMRSGDVKFESIQMDNTRVQEFGNLAVVTGRLVEKAQYNSTDISGTYRFTDVWARRNGKWEHVAGQETLVAPTTRDAKNSQLKGRAEGASEITHWQLYASADGETHFRKAVVALTERQLAPPAPPYAESEPAPATSIRYAAFPAHWGVSDRDHNVFHNASSRRFISVHRGSAWIKSSDGDIHRFNAGDIVEVLDVAPSKGHITWVGDERYVVLFSDHP